MSIHKEEVCPLTQPNKVVTTSTNLSESDAYKELVSYAPVCIHEIGLDGCLKRMNRAGLDMMGLEFEDQVVDAPYTSFVGDNNKSWIDDLLQKAIDGHPIPCFEFVIDTDDGERSFSSNFIPMLNEAGEVKKIMGVTRETTEEHRAKKALYQLNNELEDKITKATQALQQSIDELLETQSQLVESKKMASLAGLIAGVSHEINTPLSVGITAASHLSEVTKSLNADFDSGSISRKGMKKFFADAKASETLIIANLNRTADLIKSFRQIAVDQASLVVRTYRIKAYMKEVLASLQHLLRDTPYVLRFNSDNDFVVKGSPGVFHQILSNLLTNSLTHGFESHTQGEIILSIKRVKGSVYLNYQDNGCGISPEQLQLIYEPFYTTKRGKGLTGLGLHIVYNCVAQSLKGTIICKSEVVKGTEFEIKFPVRPGKSNSVQTI